MYKNEIDALELSSLDYCLRGTVADDPVSAVHHTLSSVGDLIGANLPGYTRAQNSFYTDRMERFTSEAGEITVHGSLRINCADKVIQLSRRLIEDNPEKIAEANSAAESDDGKYRVGSEVVKIWEHTGNKPELVVVAKRINNTKPRGLKIPKGQPLDDFLIDAGPALEAIVGQKLDETTNFSFVARLVQDYLRTELHGVNLNYPEYFGLKPKR